MKKRRKKGYGRFWLFAALTAAAAVAAVFLLQSPPAPSKAVKIYLYNNGRLTYVEREMPEKASKYFYIAEQLIEGPTQAEKAKGYFSQIPDGTKLRKIRKKDGTVMVDFSKELGMYGGGTTRVEGMLAQIVYTLTQFGGSKNVQILVDGKAQPVLGSEGYMIEKPLSRNDLKQ